MPVKHLTNTRRYWYRSQTKLMSVDMIAINTVQFSHQINQFLEKELQNILVSTLLFQVVQMHTVSLQDFRSLFVFSVFFYARFMMLEKIVK